MLGVIAALEVDAAGGDKMGVRSFRAAADRVYCSWGIVLLLPSRVACPWVPCGRSQLRVHAQPHVAMDHAIFTVSRPCLASMCNFLSLVRRRSE